MDWIGNICEVSWTTEYANSESMLEISVQQSAVLSLSSRDIGRTGDVMVMTD